MPKTFLHLSRWLLVAVLFVAIGGHWAVLQTVAWATMIVDYSKTAPLTEAVQKTFDGQHPCNICKGIQKSQQSEKKRNALELAKKIELFDQQIANRVFPPEVSSLLTISDNYSEARSRAPTAPPPRAA